MKKKPERDQKRWEEFEAKYDALLKDYNIELNYGCGCCSDQPTMDGIPYGWNGK